MGFHRRHISSEMLLTAYKNEGVEGIRSWYSGCDAIVAETGLASDITDLMFEEQLAPKETWEKITKLLKKEIKNG